MAGKVSTIMLPYYRIYKNKVAGKAFFRQRCLGKFPMSMETSLQLHTRIAETHAENGFGWGFISLPVPLALPTFFAVAAPESALVRASPFEDGELKGTLAISISTVWIHETQRT